MLAFLTQKSLSAKMKCHVNYTYRSCPVCVPRGNMNCGYCLSKYNCLDGDENGPFTEDCPKDMWIPNKDTCSDKICRFSKEPQYCRYPCYWRFGVCRLSRDFSIVTKEEAKVESSSIITKKMIFYCILAFIVIIVGIYIYGIYHNKRPLYKELSYLNKGINLDDLPPAALDSE